MVSCDDWAWLLVYIDSVQNTRTSSRCQHATQCPLPADMFLFFKPGVLIRMEGTTCGQREFSRTCWHFFGCFFLQPHHIPWRIRPEIMCHGREVEPRGTRDCGVYTEGGWIFSHLHSRRIATSAVGRRDVHRLQTRERGHDRGHYAAACLAKRALTDLCAHCSDVDTYKRWRRRTMVVGALRKAYLWQTTHVSINIQVGQLWYWILVSTETSTYRKSL